MEEAVFNNHFQDGLSAPSGKDLSVQPRLVHALQLPARNARNKLLHADPFTGPLPKDTGDDNDRFLWCWWCHALRWGSHDFSLGHAIAVETGVRSKILRNTFGVAAFACKIKFTAQ